MGREQQGSLQVRSGWTGTRPQELVRFQSRTPQRPPSQLPTQETERALPRAPPVSWPPPSPELPTAGSSPSPSRSNGPSRTATTRPPWSAWMPASATWPCSTLERSLPTLGRWIAPCGSCDGSTVSSTAARSVPSVGASLARDLPGSTLAPPTCDASSSSIWPAWPGTVAWPVPWPMPALASYVAGSPTTWYGSRLIVADRFYPSSKSCSACGWVKAKLTLAERTFACEACELRLDRDLNAARNLVKLAEHVAQGGWETQNARGADRKTQPAGRVAMKRESSSQDVQ